MSGHSKWSTIKRQKAVTDSRRSAIFTKHARLITVAVRAAGPDPDMNARLRLAIEKARADNMPNSNIERAIAAGSGADRGEAMKEMSYEGFGPGGVAIIVDAITDNPNRTASDVRTIFTKHGGSLGSVNSVRWMFDTFAVLRFPVRMLPADREAFELAAIDQGVDDVRIEDEQCVILAGPDKLAMVRGWLESQQITVSEAGLELIPKNTVTIGADETTKLHALLDALDEHPDVTHAVTNEA